MVACDLGATAFFAVEAAILSIDARLDLFGVLTVAFAAALGGGIVRDVVIADGPPLALRFKRYPLLAFSGGALVFLFADILRDSPEWAMVTIDAAGLSLFAVAGARRGLDFKLNGVSATMIGVLTAVGGGVIGALLLNEVPSVLRGDIYASAALLGAAVAVLGIQRGLNPARVMALGGILCFALRMVSHWQDWNLPTLS